MCGIAGIYSRAGADRELLLAMAGELRHRGPDGTGLYLDRRFGMVNTRLAIVDLAGGDQPLPSANRRFWVMQNGEIYNHVELRAELTTLGHRFRTTSDTEVIATAYQQWGVAALDRLNGDFAIAVWDRDRSELLLARDRFGVRPLFLSEAGGELSFASEAKALLRHPAARRELDPLALVEALTTWSVLPDRSAFVGIRELAPAHLLRAGPDGVIEERRWWDIDFAGGAGDGNIDADALAEELHALLRDATRLRRRADVPVAAYVSGGLDSSAIAALALETSHEELLSFGVGFEDESFDESEFQDSVATALGIPLTRITVGGAEIAALLPRVVELFEKPTLRTAPAPLLALSKAVRDAGLKVVMTGEGADELFAGYDLFREDKVRRFWARQPSSTLRPLLFARLNAFLARDLARSGRFLSSFYGRGLTDVDDPLYSHRIRFVNTGRCTALLTADVRAAAQALGDPLERVAAALPADHLKRTPLGRAQYLEIMTFLNAYLLHAQGDRMLMGNSVEGRFPFLDYRVAELAARVPDSLRLRGLEEKHILRRAVGPLLPPAVVARTKRPYRAPIAAAFAGKGAPDYVAELLSPRAVADAGIFDPQTVERVHAKAVANVESGLAETDEMALVGAVSTMLLHETFIARPRLADPLPATRVVVGATVETAAAA
ncbi:MAG: asparagine synthase (glutamine-hydrolyzing) [Gaiellales bacterium]